MSTLTLMGRSVDVAEQPWGVVAGFAETVAQQAQGLSDLAGLGLAGYELLCELAPDVRETVAPHEWMCWPSAEVMAANPGKVGRGAGPSAPEIRRAFTVALTENGIPVPEGGFDGAKSLITKLWSGLPPTVRETMAEWAREQSAPAILRVIAQARTLSSPSPSPNGASASSTGSPASRRTARTRSAGRSVGSAQH